MIARPETLVSPFDRVVALLGEVKPTAKGVKARCPAHQDNTPSLDVDHGDDGKVLLTCRSAQCSHEAICAALGIEVRDLFPDDGHLNGSTHSNGKTTTQKRKPAVRHASADAITRSIARQFSGSTLTTFDYHDTDGEHVGRVIRFDRDGEKKAIRQARRDGEQWVAEGMLDPRPLYGLCSLIANPDKQVLVVEGEGKVDALAALGFLAVTSSQGSQSPGRSDWSPLAGRHCTILPDNDKPGAGYRDVVVALQRDVGAASVAVLDLPGLGEGEDVVDWIDQRRAAGADDMAIAAELTDLLAEVVAMPNDTAANELTTDIVLSTKAKAPWPDPLGQAVRIGVLGEFLDAVEQQTEADPAAMVIDLLTRIGSAVHRGPHFDVSGDRHGCNLFSLIVGDTAQGRKGTSAAYPRAVMRHADPTWSGQCVSNGLSSGEGVIWAVRDKTQIGTDKKTGDPIFDEGAADKRLIVVETELARTMRAAGRRENTLAPILRQAWEGGRLATMTKTPYSATDAHVSLLAHVTKDEFRSLLSDNDVSGGTINRFLFVASRRQRELPFGGSVGDHVLEHLGQRLARCIDIARRHASEMLFVPAAREVWPDIYHRLQRDEQGPGIVGSLSGRATAQTRRLAMLFAIVDGSTSVAVPHLDAALEVWRYSRQTIFYVFGASTGNRVADRILGELRGTEDGIDRTAMHKLLDRHVTAVQIDEALALLQQMALARGERQPTGGRPRQIWRACS